MTQKKINAKLGILVLIVFVVALSRLFPYLLGLQETFNFSPLAALALFGGAYFSNRTSAMFFPLLALWISNLLLDNIFLSQYYDGFALFANWEVYMAILGIVGIAFLLLKKVTLPRVIGASLMASLLFFVITNFIVWINSGIYQKTMTGLVECFTLAIPFFRNTLISDMLFSVFLFGAYEMAAIRFPNLLKAKAL